MKKNIFALIVSILLWPGLTHALGVGSKVPNVSLSVLSKPSTTVNLSTIKAKYILIDFWASWCGPCKYSMPELSRLARQLYPKGLKVVGIALDDSSTKAIAFLKKHPVPFTQLSDPRKKAAKLFGIPKVPTSYLIGPNKKIIAVYVGYDKSHIEKIKKLVK